MDKENRPTTTRVTSELDQTAATPATAAPQKIDSPEFIPERLKAAQDAKKDSSRRASLTGTRRSSLAPSVVHSASVLTSSSSLLRRQSLSRRSSLRPAAALPETPVDPVAVASALLARRGGHKTGVALLCESGG